MKLPHFPFYPSDWLGSPTVISMTLEERGAYMTLLACMWQTEDCTLPEDNGYLCRLLGVADTSLVTNLVSNSMSRLVTSSGSRRITNIRLQNEHIKARKAYESRVETAANARKYKNKTESLVTNPKPEPEPEPEPKKKKTKTLVRNAVAYSDDFNPFWKIHSYGSKAEAFTAYQRIKGELPPNALEILSSQQKWEAEATRNGEKPRPLPHLSRWFKHRRWEDEPPEGGSSSERGKGYRKAF
jgi:uncharacterized protein YdaU (DUF1376 family)